MSETRLITVELLQQMRAWRLKELEELDKVILDETLSRPPLDAPTTPEVEIPPAWDANVIQGVKLELGEFRWGNVRRYFWEQYGSPSGEAG